MREYLRKLMTLVIILLASSCQNPLTPSLPLEELLAAPLMVEINGRQFRLESFLWRDFMPPAEPGGSKLAAVVYLTAVDGRPFPDVIDSNRIWVINGDKAWEATFNGEERPRDSAHLHQIVKYAAGGPKWDVGAEVDVVISVTALTSAPCLLRAPKQAIGATY